MVHLSRESLYHCMHPVNEELGLRAHLFLIAPLRRDRCADGTMPAAQMRVHAGQVADTGDIATPSGMFHVTDTKACPFSVCISKDKCFLHSLTSIGDIQER